MVPYEISFETEGARAITFPDPYALTPKHLELLMGVSESVCLLACCLLASVLARSISVFSLASDFLSQTSTNKGRFFRKHFFSCLKTTCHELLHCVQVCRFLPRFTWLGLAGKDEPDSHVLGTQALAKQEDRTACSWSAEHDASYASNSLFWLLSKCARLLLPGLHRIALHIPSPLFVMQARVHARHFRARLRRFDPPLQPRRW